MKKRTPPDMSRFNPPVKKVVGTMRIIKIILCALSLLSLFFLKALFTGDISFPTELFFVIGVLCGWLACPVKMIMMFPKMVIRGFTYGLFFVGIGCIPGALIGFAIACFITFCFPFIVTIPYLFKHVIPQDVAETVKDNLC